METQINQNLTKKQKRELKRAQKLEAFARQKRLKTIKSGLIFSAVVFFIILLFISFLKNKNSNPVFEPKLNEIQANDHIKGNKEAKVILVEYSDFQCPFCANYAPITKKVAEEFNDKIALIYRHFPLIQHNNAHLAARASEAAAKQGKFWEMHDLIFENQNQWSDAKNALDKFIQYAKDLNLDIEAFKTDINSKEVRDKVDSDYKSGLSFGVNGTPTFFLNGRKLNLPLYFETLKDKINEELNKLEIKQNPVNNEGKNN
jgi:thiol-disulfide isomerase/thioredoxin